jgi:sec-independent protein translocase protein TatC
VARRIVPRRLGPEEEATLVEHLGELRHRLFICIIAIVPAFGLTYAFHATLIRWLEDLLPPDTPLITLGVTEPFLTSLKVSFYAALVIVLPILLWQTWSFFAPALDHSLQKVIAMFVVFATTLFLGGIAFAYFILLPKALDFLVSYDSDLYESQIRASYFLSFVSVMLLATGVAFLMPIFILALVRIGVVTSATLRRNRRIGFVGMLAFAILLPTVDPVSLLLEVAPLVVLFELSIWLSVLMERRWERSLLRPYELS